MTDGVVSSMAAVRAMQESGRIEESLTVLRSWVFPTEGIRMDPGAPILARVLFVRGLMLAQNMEGVRTYLGQIGDEEHPEVASMRAALEKWRSSLGFLQRLGLAKQPPIEVPPWCGGK